MTTSDLKRRVKFANHIKKIMIRLYGKKTCFLLDGKSLVHKLHPRCQARTSKARE